jgi:hypothetical protein
MIGQQTCYFVRKDKYNIFEEEALANAVGGESQRAEFYST